MGIKSATQAAKLLQEFTEDTKNWVNSLTRLHGSSNRYETVIVSSVVALVVVLVIMVAYLRRALKQKAQTLQEKTRSLAAVFEMTFTEVSNDSLQPLPANAGGRSDRCRRRATAHGHTSVPLTSLETLVVPHAAQQPAAEPTATAVAADRSENANEIQHD